jgi:cytidylate kinase
MEHSEPDIVARISERQMRLRNALQRAEQVKDSACHFLTITGDEGTLGDEIARELAQRLGWRVYDKEIVNDIANNNHVREEMVRRLDERAQGMIYDTIFRLLRMAEGIPFGEVEYHESLMKTLAAIAAHGRAVLVGRGANFALQWSDHGLHIRTTGSSEVRIQRLSKIWNVPRETARHRMMEIDADRRAFVRQHYKQDFDDLRFYNIDFNTDHLTVGQVVDSVLSLLKSAPSSTGSGFSHN